MPAAEVADRHAESRHLPKFGIADINITHLFCALCNWLRNCTKRAHGLEHMTLRIEQRSQQGRTVLKLIGQIHSEDLEDFRAQALAAGPGRVFDLDELTLVDVGVVRYLSECEGRGVELLNCPPYIREWIKREKNRH